MIRKLAQKYFNLLILEFSTRSTLEQENGNQLKIIKSVTKRISPQSFQDLDVLNKIDMTFLGRIPFLVTFIPFNILLNKIKNVGTLDQLSAVSMAIAYLKEAHPDFYGVYTKYLKRLKFEKLNKKLKRKPSDFIGPLPKGWIRVKPFDSVKVNKRFVKSKSNKSE
jgi:hypothetical protein